MAETARMTTIPPRTKSAPNRAPYISPSTPDIERSLEEEFTAGLVMLLHQNFLPVDLKAKADAALNGKYDVSAAVVAPAPPLQDALILNAASGPSELPHDDRDQPVFTDEPSDGVSCDKVHHSWSSASTVVDEEQLHHAPTNSIYTIADGVTKGILENDDIRHSNDVSGQQLHDLVDMYDEGHEEPRLERGHSEKTLVDESYYDINIPSTLSGNDTRKPTKSKLKFGSLMRGASYKKSRVDYEPPSLAEMGLAHADKDGYMLFRNHDEQSYRRRWCILKEKAIHIFKSKMDSVLAITIHLTPDLQVIPECTNSTKDHFAFSLVTPQPGTGSHTLAFSFVADSRLDMLTWISAFVRASSCNQQRVPRILIPVCRDDGTLSREPITTLHMPSVTARAATQTSPKNIFAQERTLPMPNKRFTLSSITTKMTKPLRRLGSMSFAESPIMPTVTQDRQPVPPMPPQVPRSSQDSQRSNVPTPSPRSDSLNACVEHFTLPRPPRRTVSMKSASEVDDDAWSVSSKRSNLDAATRAERRKSRIIHTPIFYDMPPVPAVPGPFVKQH
ncbi:hypothetical protein BC832DRAFT_591722 [Gaertneriomyces semiglobifer]|nr:hypothetical protein BC832DRAFT_591722 [Gaertneriomyces semiglobifer]